MAAKPLIQAAPGWLSPGARIYAIGDVHGCAARLAELHRRVREDLGRDPASQPLLIHLGDYVDRGPDSAAVVRRLAAGPALPGVPAINLRGNHEQMMLDALTGDLGHKRDWLNNKADVTLRSWGSSATAPAEQWRAAVAAELPFLQSLPLYHAVDGYVFVHAGVRPGVRLAWQTADDLLWIREGFLDWRGPLLPEATGTAIVHGHTPKRHPQIVGQRIGIDTGAVAGGDLTCAVLEGRTVRFLAA